MPDSAPILTKKDIAQRIKGIAEAIREKCRKTDLALVGIHRRGVPLSERVYALLKPHYPSLRIGRVDISLYRDDLNSLEVMPKLVGSDISFDLDGMHVILFDEVLHTGRTSRAALDELLDHGRPQQVELAVLTLFFENSTRTRSSFEVAASRLSADVINFSVSTSSVAKGETVLDTISTLEAMRTDYVVVRHSTSGIPNLIAKNTTASVINAGDGFHAHPTQALLDVFTMKEVFGGDVRGARIAFIGDIQHSRVARSTSLLCRRMGMHVAMLAPGSLIPRELPAEVAMFTNWDELFAWKPDVIYLLRVQMERQNVPFFPSIGEYHRV